MTLPAAVRRGTIPAPFSRFLDTCAFASESYILTSAAYDSGDNLGIDSFDWGTTTAYGNNMYAQFFNFSPASKLNP